MSEKEKTMIDKIEETTPTDICSYTFDEKGDLKLVCPPFDEVTDVQIFLIKQEIEAKNEIFQNNAREELSSLLDYASLEKVNTHIGILVEIEKNLSKAQTSFRNEWIKRQEQWSPQEFSKHEEEARKKYREIKQKLQSKQS